MQRHSATRQTISRRLPAACLILVSLLLSLPIGAKEWYGETINTYTTYYIYSEGAGFLGNNNNIVGSPNDGGIATWQITSSANPTNIKNPGSRQFINLATSRVTDAFGSQSADDASFTTNSSSATSITYEKTQPKPGVEDCYYRLYTIREQGVVSKKYYNFFANIAKGTSLSSQLNARNTEWRFISTQQAQARVDVSKEELDFGTLTVGDEAERSLQVTYYNTNGLTIKLSSADDGLSVYANDNLLGSGNGTFSVSELGTYSTIKLKFIYKPVKENNWECTATVSSSALSASNSYITKGQETVTIKGSATKLTYSPIWNTGDYMNVGEIVANAVSLPALVSGADVEITDVSISTIFPEETEISEGMNGIDLVKDDAGNWVATAQDVPDGTTVTLTATINDKDNQFTLKEGSNSHTVTITSKTKQYIQWDQAYDLTTLHPRANLPLTAKVVDANGQVIADRTITYTFTPDNDAPNVAQVSNDGTTLECLGDGKGTLTAKQEAGKNDPYAPCTMSLPVVVHTSDACGATEKVASGYTSGELEIKENQSVGPFGTTLPAKISFNYYRKRAVTRNFLVKAKYEDGTEKILVQLYGGINYNSTPYSYDVDKSLTQISFICEAANLSYVKDIKYTPAQYVEPSMDNITFSSSVGTSVSNKVNIDWCNLVWHAEVRDGKTSDAAINPHFEVTTGYFGVCGEVGSDDITITYTPTEGHSSADPEKAYLCIFKDGQEEPFKSIPISAIADKLNPIVSWDLSSVTDITKSYYLDQMPPKTNSTGTITYTSSNTNIATITDKGEHTVLQFKKSGTVTLKATIDETTVHKGVSISSEITLNKVDVTRDDNYPKQYYVIEGQSLQDCALDINDFKVTYNGRNISGTVAWEEPTTVPSDEQYTVIFTPDPAQNDEKDWYNPTRFEDIRVTALQRPTFTCSPLSIDFGSASVIDGGSSPLTFSKLNNQGQTLTWHREFSGTNWNCFVIDGAISNSGCSVRFKPKDATAHTATLTIWATYTAKGLTVESARQTISLSGTGSIPKAGLSYSSSTCDFGDVYGVKQASQEVDVHFAAVSEISDASFSWKNGNSNNIFQFSYTAGGTYDGKVAITAGVNTPVAATTVYEDVLEVKAKKSFSDEEITAELPVKITLHPRRANTLALKIVEDGQNGIKAALKSDGVTVDYYYIYTDDKNVPIFQSGSRNNTDEPISITPAGDYNTYFTIDEGNYTIQPVSHSAGNISVQFTQAETDEYTGFSQTINLRVKRHTPVITIQGLEFCMISGNYEYYYALQNTDYSTLDFVSTTNTEKPLSVVATSNTDYISLNQIGDLSWGFTTFNTLNSTMDVNLTISQGESHNYEPITTQKYRIRIIKDPRHVGSEGGIPDRYVWVKKTLWENTAAGMNGKTFTSDIVNAEWVGDQWVNRSWQDTKWSTTGSSYAYVLHDGGSVVFNFTGVPYYTNIARYFAAGATSGGTLTVEESADGMVWTGIYSTAASGGSNIYMNGNSRYLRLSYNKSGTEQEYIVLWNFIRERDIATATSKFVLCKQQSSGSSYRPATVVLQTANWGLNWTKTTAEEDKVPIVVLEQTNPAFSISIQQPDSNGIDDYQEVIAYVSYNPALDETDNHMGQFKLSNSCSKNSAASYHTVFTVQAVPAKKSTITVNDTAKTGIQTGTVAPASLKGYHRGSWDVKLTHCFDKDGNALFDRLYIFGITDVINGRTNAEGYPIINNSLTQDPESAYRTEDDKKIQWEFNATTMCYVYTKGEDGKTYNYDDGLSFDATAQRFDMGSSMNGKKLYFTGYCPFACMGTTPREEGWMYFTGDDASVDIYLEDCEIMGKYKTASGCGHSKDYAYNKVELTYSVAGGGDNNYLTGCSSIFVFMANQNKIFTPNIHLCGTNSLIGQAGSFMSEIVGKAFGLEIATGIKNVGQGSAPISILNRDNSGSVVLTLDDNWPDGSTTNGYLALDATYQQAPCIDLGSVNGSVVINGGQYHLRNSAADNQYTCNTVASYRKYSKTVTVGSMSETISLYGFGGDHPEGCSMTINSGTFTMFKNMQGENFGKDYYRDQEEFLDLRLPQNTKINGGTFNGINFVLACPAANAQGVKPTNNKNTELCLKDIATSTAEDGSTIIQLPQEFIQDVQNKSGYIYRDPTPSRIVKDSVTNNLLYGGQSLNADEDGYVHFMLPSSYKINSANYTWCDALVSYHINNWATCTPAVSVGTSGQTGGISNETKVAHGASSGGLIDTTFQMLYLNVDDNIKGRSVKATGSISVEFKGNYGNITNTEDYSIGRHLNIMMNVEADKWMTFVAPFDITDVKVIEIAYEDSISQLSKKDALAAQADASINFFYKMANYIIPSLSGGRTVSHDLNTVLGVSGNDVNNERRQAGLQNLPFGQFYLDHYDGTNLWDANYYLYEIEGADNTFTTSGTGSDLDIRWIPVKKKASDARKDSSKLMQKGHVYAIQFPYCPLCNDVDTRTYYDYWTGKFIIFHGYGPQTVSGSNAQNVIKSTTTDPGTACLVGNYTFKDMSLNANTAYLHNTKNDQFEINEATATIKPTQGYMLFTAPVNSPQVASFSRAGRVVSYVQDEEVTTDSHVPSIGDRTSMLLYRLDGGFAVDPVRSQHVNIYDMRGQVLFNGYLTEGSHHPFYLSQGLYVLQGEYETLKVLVE